MILCDVNVLVYAFRADTEHHEQYRSMLETLVNGAQAYAVTDVVLTGFLRIVTHPRIFKRPTPPAEAFAFVRAVLAAPNCTRISPGERHWQVFEDLCRKVGARANVIPDAYLAALAIESRCELLSADRGFAQFPGLRYRHPLD